MVLKAETREALVYDEVLFFWGELKKPFRLSRAPVRERGAPGSERSQEAAVEPERDFIFVLLLSDVVFARALKPTTEITKNNSTSKERRMLRTMLCFLLTIE